MKRISVIGELPWAGSFPASDGAVVPEGEAIQPEAASTADARPIVDFMDA
jgi:hypothetical protein